MADASAISTDDQPPARGPALLWVVRVAALLGFLISGYLFVLALRGVAPPGCGGGSGCGDVLASRWAKVGPFPVSGLAMAVYLVALAASLHAGPRSPAAQRAKAWHLVNIAAVAAGGAALWFVGLMLFELGHTCVFCLAAHTCSLALAATALWHGPRALPLVGLAGVAALIGAQHVFRPPVVVNPHVHITGLAPANAPTLGDSDAPVVVGYLYDYNCYYCRQTHAFLHQAVERYDGRLAVVLLPTALDPACNKHIQQQEIVSVSSCAIARLMLAVWVADPAKLAEFDAYLLTHIPREKIDGSVPPEVVAGAFTDEARRLVGADALDAGLVDPRIDARLKRSEGLYAVAVDPVVFRRGVPRVIIDELVYPAFEDADQLFGLLEQQHPELIAADQTE